jgi:hypothetical protein
MDAGCCHSARAKGRKIETLRRHRESVVEGQLKFEAGSSESPSPSTPYQLSTTPHCRRRSPQKLGGFVGFPQSTTTTSSATLLATTLHGLLWRLGSLFSLSVPSVFIRGAAAPLLADPTTTLTAARGRYRSNMKQRSLAACGFWLGFESCRANHSSGGV